MRKSAPYPDDVLSTGRTVAKRLGVELGKVAAVYGRTPGVIRLPSGKRRRVLLIPEAVIKERAWTSAEMAEFYGLPERAIVYAFSNEPGVLIDETGTMQIPESVRRRVFKKYTNK
jgi:hypothetical protein